MLVTYRRCLESMSYEALLVEAHEVWAIEAPEQYDRDDLIEILVGKEEESMYGH